MRCFVSIVINWDVHGRETAWKRFSIVESGKMHVIFQDIRQQVIWCFHGRENDLQSTYRLSWAADELSIRMSEDDRIYCEPFFNVFRWDRRAQWDRILNEAKKSNLAFILKPYFNHLPDLFFSILLLNWIYLESTFFEFRPELGRGATKKTFSRLHTSRQTDRTPESHPSPFEWRGLRSDKDNQSEWITDGTIPRYCTRLHDEIAEVVKVQNIFIAAITNERWEQTREKGGRKHNFMLLYFKLQSHEKRSFRSGGELEYLMHNNTSLFIGRTKSAFGTCNVNSRMCSMRAPNFLISSRALNLMAACG